MRAKTLRIAALLSALVGSGASFAAPWSVTYGGRLTTPDGAPVVGPVDLDIGLFGGASGGAPLHAPQEVKGVALTNGVFQVPLSLVPADVEAPVWIEVKDATHGKTYPRQRFSAVPYALRVPVDGTSVVFDGDGHLSVGAVDAAKVTGLSAMLADMGDAAKLQGVPLGTGTPAAGAVLKYVGGQWQAAAGDSVSGNFGIGTTSAQTALDVAGVLTQRGNAAPAVAPAGEGRIYFDATSNQFMVSQNGGAYAPLGTVTGGVITQVSAGAGLTGGGTTGNVTVGMPNVGTAGTYTRVVTDAYGRVTAGGTLTAADLPGVPVGLINGSLPVTQLAGTLATAQIPQLSAAQITSGTFTAAQIPALDAGKITTGQLAVADGGTGANSFTNNGVVVGSGAGPLSATAAGSQYEVLTVNGSGQPVFGAVNLDQGAAVTGTLPVANGGTGSATALTGNRLVMSSGTALVEAPTLSVVGGNVGIGTTSASQQLEIQGPGPAVQTKGTTVASYAEQQVLANGDVRFILSDANANGRRYDLGQGATNYTSDGTLVIKDVTAGIIRLSITPTGNVGIGTTSGSTLLDVAGALTERGMAQPAVAPAGQGRLYFDSTAGQFLVSQNGGAYAPLSTLTALGSAGSYTKVVTDSFGRVTAGTTLGLSDLPSIPTSQITGTLAAAQVAPIPTTQLTGTLAGAQVGTLAAGQITSGTLALAQLPPVPTTKVTGTLAAAQIDWSTPGAIGSATANSGSFTTLRTTGSLGVGTSTPNTNLTVVGSTNQFNITDPTSTWGLLLTGADHGSGGSYHGAGDGTSAAVINVQTGPLFLGTANAPRLTVDSSGNVGIGTTSPGTKLTVVPTGTYDGIKIERVNSGNDNASIWGLTVKNSAGTDGLVLGETSSAYTTGGPLGWAGNSHSYVYYPSELRIGSGPGATPVATFNGSGNVGIGTASPLTALDVGATASGDWLTLRDTNGLAANDEVGLRFRSGASNDIARIHTIYDGAGGNRLVFSTTQTGTGTLTERLRIDASGNVGIGSTIPGAKLEVVQDGTANTTPALRITGSSGDPTNYHLDVIPFTPVGGQVDYKFSMKNVGSTTTPLYLQGTTGNVGIGTSTPGQKLSVAGTIESTTGGFKFPDGTVQTTAQPILPYDYVGGLTLSRPSATSVQLSAGSARDDADSMNLTLSAAFSKSLAGTWVAGSGSNGLDTGTVAANSLYYVWLIGNPTNGNVDLLLSLSGSAPTLPSGYTKKRRITFVMTNGSSQIYPLYRRVGVRVRSYCGYTPSQYTGAGVGGWAGAAAKCQAACGGSTTADICSWEEIKETARQGLSSAVYSSTYMWITDGWTAAATDAQGYRMSACADWTSAGSGKSAQTAVQDTDGTLVTQTRTCDTSRQIACCDY